MDPQTLQPRAPMTVSSRISSPGVAPALWCRPRTALRTLARRSTSLGPTPITWCVHRMASPCSHGLLTPSQHVACWLRLPSAAAVLPLIYSPLDTICLYNKQLLQQICVGSLWPAVGADDQGCRPSDEATGAGDLGLCAVPWAQGATYVGLQRGAAAVQHAAEVPRCCALASRLLHARCMIWFICCYVSAGVPSQLCGVP